MGGASAARVVRHGRRARILTTRLFRPARADTQTGQRFSRAKGEWTKTRLKHISANDLMRRESAIHSGVGRRISAWVDRGHGVSRERPSCVSHRPQQRPLRYWPRQKKGWQKRRQSFDVISEKHQKLAEIKNKHNTMNAANRRKVDDGLNAIARRACLPRHRQDGITRSRHIFWKGRKCHTRKESCAWPIHECQAASAASQARN